MISKMELNDILKEIEERAEKATPGPWILETVSTTSGTCHKIGPFPSNSGVHPVTHACVYADNVRSCDYGHSKTGDELLANAQLMATSRTDVPALVKALRNMLVLLSVAKCPNCDGSGAIPVPLGEHFVTHEMAMDAGEPSMAGQSMGIEWGAEQCQWCDEKLHLSEYFTRADNAMRASSSESSASILKGKTP